MPRMARRRPSNQGKGHFEGGIQELARESSSLRQLVIQARERGVVTIEEIKSALAQSDLGRLEELIAGLEDMGMTIGCDENHGSGGLKGDPAFLDQEARAVPISEARQNLAELCNRVAYGGERLVIARRGKARAALVSVEDLALLRAVEDAVDLAAARGALREVEKAGTKRLEEVLHDLGLDAEVG